MKSAPVSIKLHPSARCRLVHLDMERYYMTAVRHAHDEERKAFFQTTKVADVEAAR